MQRFSNFSQRVNIKSTLKALARLPDRIYATENERNFLMHDRDSKFTKAFDEIDKSTGCEIKQSRIMSPNLQAHAERVVQTLKHEVLNEFVAVSEKHLKSI